MPKQGDRITPLKRAVARASRQGECLVFMGSRNPAGYGRVMVPTRGPLLAHRLVWEAHNGPIPAGLMIMHSCDNPPCIEISHLSLGTRADNMADMVNKGRSLHRYGAENPNIKLTDSQVRRARELAADGHTFVAIAALLGAHRTHISRIVKGQRRQLVDSSPQSVFKLGIPTKGYRQ